MDARYRIEDTSEIISPGLVVFRDLVQTNIERMVDVAGDPSRLRPHCKTHKMREVVRMQMNLGITKHKCATFAEAEMLADAGVKDIVLAYNIVGPNLGRAVSFVEKFSEGTLCVTADHALPIRQLGEAMSRAGRSVDVLLDIDTGQSPRLRVRHISWRCSPAASSSRSRSTRSGSWRFRRLRVGEVQARACLRFQPRNEAAAQLETQTQRPALAPPSIASAAPVMKRASGEAK